MRHSLYILFFIFSLCSCKLPCIGWQDYSAPVKASYPEPQDLLQQPTQQRIQGQTRPEAYTQASTSLGTNQSSATTVSAPFHNDSKKIDVCSPCGEAKICQFDVDRYTICLAGNINKVLIQKDYIENSIVLKTKCNELGCDPPPFHASFEGSLQEHLLGLGVLVRSQADEKSLILKYHPKVIPYHEGKDTPFYKSMLTHLGVEGRDEELYKLILTSTISQAGRLIFSDTAYFTIYKTDAWQYQMPRPARFIPITNSATKIQKVNKLPQSSQIDVLHIEESTQVVEPAQTPAPITLEPRPLSVETDINNG